MESDWPVHWQLAVSWNGGSSSAVAVSPNEAWRAEEQSGSYVLVSDDDVIPALGEIVVTSGADALLRLDVLVNDGVVVMIPFPSGMRAAVALAT